MNTVAHRAAEIPTGGSSENISFAADLTHPSSGLAHEMAIAVATSIASLGSPSSRHKYQQAIRHFARFIGATTLPSLITSILEWRAPRMSARLRDWDADMESRGLSAATRSQRRAGISLLLNTLRFHDAIDWAVPPLRLKVTPLRDTRGPTLPELRRIFDAASSQGGIAALRDVAILELLSIVGLRRAEVASLNAGDLDRTGQRLRVKGKGRDDHELIGIPDAVVVSLAAYLDSRQAEPSEPMFVGMGPRSSAAERLRPGGIYRLVDRLARRAGVATGSQHVGAHKLRHSAITLALDATQGDVRRVRAFSRHAKVDTVVLYDDRRRDPGAEVARMVSSLVHAGTREGGSDIPDPCTTKGRHSGSGMVVSEPIEGNGPNGGAEQDVSTARR